MGNKTITWPSSGLGQGEIVITAASIITEILNSSNWDVNGDYTGSEVGLIRGNIHYDDGMNMKYIFDGTTLRRFVYNELI